MATITHADIAATWRAVAAARRAKGDAAGAARAIRNSRATAMAGAAHKLVEALDGNGNPSSGLPGKHTYASAVARLEEIEKATANPPAALYRPMHNPDGSYAGWTPEEVQAVAEHRRAIGEPAERKRLVTAVARVDRARDVLRSRHL